MYNFLLPSLLHSLHELYFEFIVSFMLVCLKRADLNITARFMI